MDTCTLKVMVTLPPAGMLPIHCICAGLLSSGVGALATSVPGT